MSPEDDGPTADPPAPANPDGEVVEQARAALDAHAPGADTDDLPELDLAAIDVDVDVEGPRTAPSVESSPPVGDDSPLAAAEAVPDPDPELVAARAALAAAERRADELAVVARRQSDMADELHAENRTLRAGEIREATAPLVRGLARLADDLDRLRAADDTGNADLAYLAGQVDELLHDAGVLREAPVPGERFDPQAHQAAGSATTADPALDRTISAVRRPGLRAGDGRLLRPAEVVVHRHAPDPTEGPTA